MNSDDVNMDGSSTSSNSDKNPSGGKENFAEEFFAVKL
jgi:hypothetical protein